MKNRVIHRNSQSYPHFVNMSGINRGKLDGEQLFGVSGVKKCDSNKLFVDNSINLQKV